MKRLFLPMCLLLLTLPTASRPAPVRNPAVPTPPPAAPPKLPAPLRVTVFPHTQKAASGFQFAITMRVTNVSPVPQTIVTMSCSWEENWTARPSRPAEHARLGLGGMFACFANAPEPTTLPPGGFLEKQTVLTVMPDDKPGPRTVHYRVGFATKPDAFYPGLPGTSQIPVYWSDEAVITTVK